MGSMTEDQPTITCMECGTPRPDEPAGSPCTNCGSKRRILHFAAILAKASTVDETISIVMGCAIPIVAIVGVFWYKIVKATSENDLKRRMVERGMSPDEIERVLAARSHS